MFLGALLDLGLPLEFLQDLVVRMGLDGVEIKVGRVERDKLTALLVDVLWDGSHPHRGLGDILSLLESAHLPEPVKHRASAVFKRLATAEARVHGVSEDRVHFHEVGAVDALVDIVGTVAGFYELGIAELHCSALPMGQGTVDCAHGTLPLPAPATVQLLRGVPLYGVEVRGETVTPTGAALVAELVDTFGPMPAMTLVSTGSGAGHSDLGLPGFFRILAGRRTRSDSLDSRENIIIETNIDDMNPQLYEHVISLLFDTGALDVFLTPIQMKKSRPATMLSVLAPRYLLDDLSEVIFCETTSIGLRVYPVEKRALRRKEIQVQTPWGPIPAKLAFLDGRVVNVSPEYEHCRSVARDNGFTLAHVMDLVRRVAASEL